VAFTMALNAMTNEFTLQRTETAQREAAKAAPKTIDKKMPSFTPRLCRLTKVATANQVPDLWKLYAASDKKEALMMMQGWFDSRANATTSSGVAPVMTPELYASFQLGEVAGRDADDIVGGLSIFKAMPSTAAAANARFQ